MSASPAAAAVPDGHSPGGGLADSAEDSADDSASTEDSVDMSEQEPKTVRLHTNSPVAEHNSHEHMALLAAKAKEAEAEAVEAVEEEEEEATEEEEASAAAAGKAGKAENKEAGEAGNKEAKLDNPVRSASSVSLPGSKPMHGHRTALYPCAGSQISSARCSSEPEHVPRCPGVRAHTAGQVCLLDSARSHG